MCRIFKTDLNEAQVILPKILNKRETSIGKDGSKFKPVRPCPAGSTFSLTLPLKRNGSCGMMAMAPRRRLRGTAAALTPSISTPPDSTSTKRKRIWKSELFPAPVRPTTPIFSAGRVARLRGFP